MTNITTQTGSTTEPSTTEQATNKAGEVASTARQEAADVAHHTKHQARRLAQESRDQLRQQAGQQTQRVAQTMRDIGGQLQNMASGQAPPNGMLADVTEQAASSAHRMADKLDRGGFDGVISDVKQFARRRPGIFIAGALGAGLLAGRLVRSMDTNAVMQAAKPGGDTGGGSGETDSGTEAGLGSGNGQPLAPSPISAGAPVTSVPPGPGTIGPRPVDSPTEL